MIDLHLPRYLGFDLARATELAALVAGAVDGPEQAA